MPSRDELRRGSLCAEPQSYHATMHELHENLICLPLSVASSAYSPRVTHKAYLQVSAGVTGRLPLRHVTAALLPRTAHSFAGFVQITTLLSLSCNPVPSALHCSLSTPV